MAQMAVKQNKAEHDCIQPPPINNSETELLHIARVIQEKQLLYENILMYTSC